MMAIRLVGLTFFVVLLFLKSSRSDDIYNNEHITCREPNTEMPSDEREHRKFLLFGGEGAGLGNFLVYFPAAWSFAALTGRGCFYIFLNFTLTSENTYDMFTFHILFTILCESRNCYHRQ